MKELERPSWMSAADRERLRGELDAKLSSKVELRVSSDDGASSRQAFSVLEEIAGLSDRLALVPVPPTGLDPRIEVRGRARGRLAFVGLPMGYEFPTLIEAIFDVSRGETGLQSAIRDRLAQLAGTRRLDVYTSPT